jgi:hypothetical protein
MPEQNSNVEFAHQIQEQAHLHGSTNERQPAWIEIAEAVVLAVVAVATAWSGYQATKWDALSNLNYSLAIRTSVKAQEKATLEGQDRLYDITTFNSWIEAETASNKKLAGVFEHRFRPEYEAAFLAWQRLDPLNNLLAPPGPIFMPEYTNASSEESRKLIDEANSYFEKGVKTRETGDHYVKISVFLATVLLMTALGQRFKVRAPRIVMLSIAFILLIVSTFWIITLPRA